MSDKKTVFDFLLQLEDRDHNFSFGRDSNNGMWISYLGYQHMNIIKCDEILRKKFRLKYNFDKNITQYDSLCGRTFYYYRDVYDNN